MKLESSLSPKFLIGLRIYEIYTIRANLGSQLNVVSISKYFGSKFLPIQGSRWDLSENKMPTGMYK